MLIAVALAIVVTGNDRQIVASIQLRDTARVDSACAVRGGSVRQSQSQSASEPLSLTLSRQIALAAAAGRTLPPALTSYRARVESEIALVIRAAAPRDGAGSGGARARERAAQVEQVASALASSSTGGTDQHVIGYRARAIQSNAAGAQAGWAGATSPAARSALALFGTRTDTLTGLQVLATRPTDGVRSTVNITLRLFGGTIGLGIARPLDRHAPRAGWQFIFGAGQAF